MVTMEILLIEESDNFLECNSYFCFCHDSPFLVDEDPYCTLEEEDILEVELKTEQ